MPTTHLIGSPSGTAYCISTVEMKAATFPYQRLPLPPSRLYARLPTTRAAMAIRRRHVLATPVVPTLHHAPGAQQFTAVLAGVVNQFDLLWSHDLQNDTGLLVHGYDASKTAGWANAVIGTSPIVWGRAMGWYITSLVKALELLMSGELLPAFQHLRARYVDLADAIGRPGHWRLVVSPPRTGNQGHLQRSFDRPTSSRPHFLTRFATPTRWRNGH